VVTPLEEDESIYSQFCILYFDVNILERVSIHLPNQPLLLSHSSPLPSSHLLVEGDIELYQKSPFVITSSLQTLSNEDENEMVNWDEILSNHEIGYQFNPLVIIPSLYSNNSLYKYFYLDHFL